MTGVIATIPRIQFFDIHGNPLIGGKLYTYLAGTTTLVATYQDQALTTKNGNPIPLDFTGSCSIWLDPAKSYKFVLKGPLGVTQPGWPVDNISGASNLISLGPTLNALLRSADLAAKGGAKLVGTSSGENLQVVIDGVQNWLDILRGGTTTVYADHFLETSNPIKSAIDALPDGGGVVVLSNRRYPPVKTDYDANRITKDNVRIVGAKMPVLSGNADRLEAGSVIEGRFNVFANNFSIENVGFDCGKYVVDTYYGGVDTHTANHPLGGTWDAFAFAQPATPLPPRRGFSARNVIGLCRDSNALGHSMLMEGIDGGFVDNVVAVYGVHGIVFKSKNIRGGSVAGYLQSSQGVLFKSDTAAICEKIQLASVDANRYPPGVTPWSAPPIPMFGIFINPSSNSVGQIQIDTAKSFGATRGMNFDGAVGQTGADIQIGRLICDGYTGAMDYAVIGQNATFERVQIGQLIANNANQGAYWIGADTLEIGNARFTQILNYALMAAGNGRIRVGVAKFATCGSAYYCDDAARIYVGQEELRGVTTKFFRTPPGLASGWDNFGAGNSTFDVMLKNFKVEIKGLAKAASGTTSSLISLPTYLLPPENKRYETYYNNGTRADALINVTTGGAGLILNDGTAPAAGDYVSLDGIAWEY